MAGGIYLESSLGSEDLVMSVVTEDCVIDAFSHLKLGKGDGTVLASDHWVHALPALSSSLAALFTAILRHGYMPDQLRNCVIVPIPKSNKDPALTDNYRPIALAPTLSKALEWCILLSYPQCFLTSGLQFGFKQKMSTSLCTGTLKNIVSRYLHCGSPVFACFLNASKAFDLVNHDVSFKGCLIGIFLLILLVFCCLGIRISPCLSSGESPFLHLSLYPMTFVKGAYSHPFCLP